MSKFSTKYNLLIEALMINKTEFLLQIFGLLYPEEIEITQDGKINILSLKNTIDNLKYYQDFCVTTEMVKNGKLIINFNKSNKTFYCNNLYLNTLEGCPKAVLGTFTCYDNNLKNLIGGPKAISDNFDCSDNNLTSLEGCPEEIPGSFLCNGNDVTSLKHFPKRIGQDLHMLDNQTKFTIKQIEEVCQVTGKIIGIYNTSKGSQI